MKVLSSVVITAALVLFGSTPGSAIEATQFKDTIKLEVLSVGLLRRICPLLTLNGYAFDCRVVATKPLRNVSSGSPGRVSSHPSRAHGSAESVYISPATLNLLVSSNAPPAKTMLPGIDSTRHRIVVPHSGQNS